VRNRQIFRTLPISVLGVIAVALGLPVEASEQVETPHGLIATAPPQFSSRHLASTETAGREPTAQVLSTAGSHGSLPTAQTMAHLWQDGGSGSPDPPESTPDSRPGRRPDDSLNLPRGRQRSQPNRSPLGQPQVAPLDPADTVAPAVIELSPTPGQLNPVLSHAMEQQLRNLIGRFESALLLTNSLDSSTTLTIQDIGSDLTATETATEKETSDINASPLPDITDNELPPALRQARDLLEDWDTLLATGRYTEAQERWIEARNDLWEYMPAERPFAEAGIRAIWLDRGTIVKAQSPAGLEQIFDQLAAAGINTVFLETVNAGYPIYHSRVAPQQNPLIGPWDPLATAVDLAHERGMALHAWVWVFAAGNQRHNRILNLPENYPGPILSGNPDWAGYDNYGNPIPPGQDKPFLDPANPEVRSYLTRLMTEIVTEYEVDGLQLDYIRYPFQNPSANRTYGYGEVARWRFRSNTGVDPVDLQPRPSSSLSPQQQAQQQRLWQQWTDFRIQQVNSFVETLSQTLRRHRPDLILSAAVFAKSEHERLQKIQQDWGTWARNGDIDWVVLMSYAQDTSRFEQLINPWLVEETFGNSLVIPGIRVLDLSPLAVMDQLQVTRDLPTPGYALFATADLQTELSTYLAQTQGETATQPSSTFQIAFSRYQSLQREWSWLLSRNKLWMNRDQLTRWVEHANQLETDFQALAAEPSRRNYNAVERGLRQVQEPLNGTVLIETVNSSYRLRAWQHRLVTIDRLLRYGERSAFRDL
jgi:uncharacterized lipoprotein YddW (UPF0748 family)